MEKSRFRPFYAVSKSYLRFTLRCFYRRWEQAGYDAHMPPDVPIFLTPNHQNAFIDALNVGASTKRDRQPSFLTRSDVFIKAALPLMNAYKMLPIYRQRDGGPDVLKKNEEIFDICVDRLHHNEAILIFPEGNHGRIRRLRPLKKGFARIAFQAAEAAAFDFPLHIVPIGLNYSNHLTFQADVLIVYGPPLKLADYYDRYRSNPSRALIDLRNDLFTALSACMIHIKTREHYDLVEGMRQLFGGEVAVEMGLNPDKLYDRFRGEKALIEQLEAQLAADNTELIAAASQLEAYQAGLAALKLRDHVIQNGPYRGPALWGQGMALLLSLPIFLWGALNHYHVYRGFRWVARRFFKDDHFHSSIQHIQGFALLPFLYLGQAGIVAAVAGSIWGLAYLLTVLPAGLLAMRWQRGWRKWRARLTYQRLQSKGDTRLGQLISLRELLRAQVRKAMPITLPPQVQEETAS